MTAAAVPALLSGARPQAVLAVLLALGLHGALLVALDRPEGGASAKGEGGRDLVSLVPAPPDLAALVARWETPPLPVEPPAAIPAPPLPAPTPDVPSVAASVPLPTPDVPLTELPAPERPPPAPLATEPPQPRSQIAPAPAPRQARAPAPPPQPAARAQGAGKGMAAGQAGADQAGTAQTGASDALTAWGAEIRARVERKKSFPRSARGLTGTVAVTLTVARDGRLITAAIAASSGHEVLDGAALKAVRAAGRFPRGPADLADAHSFTFNLRFIP